MKISRARLLPSSWQKPQSSILFSESNFKVKYIKSEKDKVMSYQLRHRIFCNELKWVPRREDSQEVDSYDKDATSIGVYNEAGNLVSMVRIIVSDNTFMLEKEFPFLLEDGYNLRKERDTVELSRLCVAPEARNATFADNFGLHVISMLLYKGVYHWCLANTVRYIYMVVEQRVYRLLCAKGFPCKLVGAPVVMPDGVEAVAAILDWREFEMVNIVRRPKLLEWFSRYQSSRPTKLRQQRGSDSLHQAFS
ncbi:acyl-homoserine-lactone synthase [Geotalea uraniireducens]|uniref:N-acyl-L-homoserine lactone synthetase-like protein n=1 Tax=Geotalea uraniireducens (strain Rf4) TaxID=351605 RepID=A5G658_GEOUR|nr:acyl-homoserine-lactone synthase [Geotalea uraniireducens]ABQ27276.1 N-acyl-L-homoserine lactone synthetase-like protein [Geotalea uraniireducens Rf4]